MEQDSQATRLRTGKKHAQLTYVGMDERSNIFSEKDVAVQPE
jgi:hypothetical protein